MVVIQRVFAEVEEPGGVHGANCNVLAAVLDSRPHSSEGISSIGVKGSLIAKDCGWVLLTDFISALRKPNNFGLEAVYSEQTRLANAFGKLAGVDITEPRRLITV